MIALARYKDRIYGTPEYKVENNPVFTHYFITSHDWVPLVEKGATSKDNQRILVFISRDQATIFAMECEAVQDFLIVGLTTDTWNIFKQTEKYIIVSEEERDNAKEM